jgi:hypothetical protein
MCQLLKTPFLIKKSNLKIALQNKVIFDPNLTYSILIA